jgi:voltage-gated potassium channel Kch
MDVSMSQIDAMRAFGRRVNYGDATRLDLLHAAGAANARILIVAIDDRERAVELVEIARRHFPHLKILARAWDRRDAYDLAARGAHHVERETFEGSLSLGRAALRALGMRAHRAHRATALFRAYDIKQFEKMRARWGEDRQSFIRASRQSYEMFQRVLDADLEALGADSVLGEWEVPGRPTQVADER